MKETSPADGPKLHLSLTHGKKILGLASFTPRTAQIALDILSCPPQWHREYAAGIIKCLKQLRQGRYLRSDTCIQGNKFDPQSGLAVGETVQIPWKVAEYVSACLMLKSPAEIEFLKADLTRIVMGTLPADAIRHPFLHAQGVVKA